ncbi:hypothetical protein OROMI_024430 [Orobanche minor]
MSSQEILKVRDGTPLEMSSQEILKIRDGTHLELDIPSNVVQKKRVARILVFKIRSSQEILKIRDGTPLEAEGILTYRKRPSNCSVLHFSSKLDVPSNVVQKKRVARILVFKIRSSQEILKIRDGTTLEKKRVARILVFKIRSSQEILKIRDGTHLEAEGILTYRKDHRNCSVLHFSSKLDVPSNVVQKKRVARILVFKIRSSQEILKILDGTPLEAEGILTYRKKPPKLLESSQEILKVRDGTPLELDVPSNVVQKKRVARILVFKIRSSQEILKIRDGTHLEAEGILTYRKDHRNCSVLHFSSKLDVPSNVVQKKRVARILVFKIRPSQEILKIRDGTTPLEAEGILTYRKRPSQEILKILDGTPLEMPSQEILKILDGTPLESGRNFDTDSSKLDVPSNVVQKKRVARILVFKIRSSQEILKIRDGTHLEAEGILTYRKDHRNCSVLHFSSKLDVPSNVVQKKRVARILVFKIRSSQEILKILDGTPLEAEGILTYRKKPPKLLDVPSNVVQKKRVARILVFKIRSSQEILKIRDGTHLEAEGILTYRKDHRNCSVLHFSSKLDVPSNVVQKKRVARILVFKIRSSQEILKILDGTPLEAEGILTYRKKPPKLLGLALF